MIKFKQGQSTLEYVIILAAVVGAIILVATTVLKPKLQTSYSDLTGKMQQKVSNVNF